jgi:hypothetical protein
MYFLKMPIICTKIESSLALKAYFKKNRITKSNERPMVTIIIVETKREGQKMHNSQEPKKKERASPSCGRKLFHPWPL